MKGMKYAILVQASLWNYRSPLLFFRKREEFEKFINVMLSKEEGNRSMSFNSCYFLDKNEKRYYSDTNKLELTKINGKEYRFSWNAYHTPSRNNALFSVKFLPSLETTKFEEEFKKFITLPPCSSNEVNALFFKKHWKSSDMETGFVLLASPRLKTILNSVHYKGVTTDSWGYASREDLSLADTNTREWSLMPGTSYIHTFRKKETLKRAIERKNSAKKSSLLKKLLIWAIDSLIIAFIIKMLME